MQYFLHSPVPFARSESDLKPKSKVSKIDDSYVSELEIVKCCYRFLQSDLTFYKNVWNWSEFFKLYSVRDDLHKNCLQKLFCNYIMAMLTNMSDIDLKYLNRNIPEETIIKSAISSGSEKQICPSHQNRAEIKGFESDWIFSNENIFFVDGVSLLIYDLENRKAYLNGIRTSKCERIVPVQSTKTNLTSLALGISFGRAICLAGSVGCGKTTLVEYLAHETGRITPKIESSTVHDELVAVPESVLKTKNSPSRASAKRKLAKKPAPVVEQQREPNLSRNCFLRIQLGDQTDSKMLLGQYRCTDVPGEFVWQPGVLTQVIYSN